MVNICFYWDSGAHISLAGGLDAASQDYCDYSRDITLVNSIHIEPELSDFSNILNVLEAKGML